jgi:hypothetical protein
MKHVLYWKNNTFGLFFHIFAPTTKALFIQIVHDFKDNCRITMEFSDKVDSIKYSTVP